MRLSKLQHAQPIGFNMTPMIDIVFLLIIFFMTVSQLNQNVLPPIQLPTANGGQDRAMPAEIVLNLSSTGQLLTNDRTIEQVGIEEFLQQEKVRWSSEDQMPRVKLRCEAKCSTTHVNFVFDRLSELGFEFVTVAVKKQ